MGTIHYLTINENQTIAGIQEKFTSVFPFLKVEFFKERHRAGIGSEKKNMLTDRQEKIFRLQQSPKAGKVTVDSGMTVLELEEEFDQKFGLFIQVFRKSGSIWLETSKTDNWTLEQQDAEGRSIQQEMKAERESPDDHDIW